MSFLSLFSGDHAWLASDQRVFSADEVSHVESAIAQVDALSTAAAAQSRQLEQARVQARKEGYREGIEQARREGQRAQARQMAELQARHQRLVEEQREACAHLSLEVVRKIAGSVAPADWLYAQASVAAAELVDASDVVLRVHPDQAEAVRERLSADSSTVIGHIRGDESLAPDGCMLDTRHGHLLIDLETQLDEVLRLFSEQSSRDV